MRGPSVWTPLHVVRPALDHAVVEFDLVCTPGLEWRDWRVLLFQLWLIDNVELEGMPSRADRPKKREVISYPHAERLLRHFDFDQLASSRLVHLRSGRIHYDLHLRDPKQVADVTAIEASHVDTKEPSATTLERRAALYHAAWVQEGRPPAWTAEQFHAAALARNPDDPLLHGKIEDRTKRAAARAARAKG